MSETKECDEDLATDVVNASLSTAIDRDQALALREAIIDLSQRCWAAYWMYDCEYALWTFSGGGTSEPKQTKWGIGGVSVEDGARLQELAKACGGWWMWQSGKRGSTEVFVPMARWLELVKARGTAIATEVHAEDESLQYEANSIITNPDRRARIVARLLRARAIQAFVPIVEPTALTMCDMYTGTVRVRITPKKSRLYPKYEWDTKRQELAKWDSMTPAQIADSIYAQEVALVMAWNGVESDVSYFD